MSRPDPESRFPVGSSARMMSGSQASARAIATRCIWPRESSVGLCFIRSMSATCSKSLSTRSLRSLVPVPRKRSGISTFS